MGNNLRYVFLDVGETMVQVTGPGPVYSRILAEYGYTFTPEYVATTTRALFQELDATIPRQRNPDHTISAELAALRRERLIETLVARLEIAEAHAAAVGAALRASWTGPHLFPLYPDVPAVLEALRGAGLRLGIVSNWEPGLPDLCASLGIRDHFDFVVVSETEGYVKPHPRMFERALELAGVAPDQAIHVGDSYPEDIEGARALGIAGVLVDRKRHGRIPYHPTINALAELPALLAERARQ